jgi:hypothetical protein
MNGSSSKQTSKGLDIRVISDGKTFSVQTYFDVCPESPDGKYIVYSRFTGGIPGRMCESPKQGHVVLVERESGRERIIGSFAAAFGHTGAYTLWIDRDHAAYQDVSELCIVNVVSGTTRRLKGACQMYDPVAGAIFQNADMNVEKRDEMPQGFYRLDLSSGRISKVIGIEDIAELSFVKSLGTPDKVTHAKWSPKATRAAGRVDGVRQDGKGRYPFIFTCRPDGSDFIPFKYYSNGNIDKPMHWNFYDEHSIYGYDVARSDRPCCRWALDGAFIEILHEGDGNHGAVSKNGDYFVTDSWYGVEPRRVMFYRKGDRKPVVLAEMTNSKLVDAHPALSGDGRRAYFNRSRQEDYGSQVCSVDLSDLVLQN